MRSAKAGWPWIENIVKNVIDRADMVTYLGLLYGRVHEPELACAALEQSLSRPNGTHVGQMRTHPDYDPLRNEPYFERLLVKFAPRD